MNDRPGKGTFTKSRESPRLEEQLSRQKRGFGLIAIWLTLVNGIVHAVQALALRRYNPGLVTAILLFLPAGITGVWVLHASGHGSSGWQTLGFAVAAAIHAAIIVHVRRRRDAVSAR